MPYIPISMTKNMLERSKLYQSGQSLDETWMVIMDGVGQKLFQVNQQQLSLLGIGQEKYQHKLMGKN